MNDKTIGYIGLGIMGKPAAINLLKNGYTVNVWARRGQATTAPLVAAGAKEFSSIAALANNSDVVITNVSDTPDVESIALSTDGIISTLKPGGLVIDMSTISPEISIKIANELEKKGIDFLDAPVSGGEKGAIDGTLTFMVGGKTDAFVRATPIFSAMGKTMTHIGTSGSGQIAKICNQVIIGATISGVAEAFSLAKKRNVDLSKIRQALQGGFAASKVLEIHAERMISGDYTPGFKTALHSKDINIALSEAKANQSSLPSAEIFQQRLKILMEEGKGNLDSSAIMMAIQSE